MSQIHLHPLQQRHTRVRARAHTNTLTHTRARTRLCEQDKQLRRLLLVLTLSLTFFFFILLTLVAKIKDVHSKVCVASLSGVCFWLCLHPSSLTHLVPKTREDLPSQFSTPLQETPFRMELSVVFRKFHINTGEASKCSFRLVGPQVTSRGSRDSWALVRALRFQTRDSPETGCRTTAVLMTSRTMRGQCACVKTE